ncbi:MAG TPA: type IV pilus secretin PilQ [Candidatus Acidoferrales bacterium]|nr:type IV pilus secretin PilQ [Candidatus Acidoferrales bacterium]
MLGLAGSARSRLRLRHPRWLGASLGSVAVAVAITACAAGPKDAPLEKPPHKEAVPAGPQTQPPAPSVKEQALPGRPLAAQELSVREQNQQTVIRVIFSQPATQYRHFTLAQPARIVLDVFGDVERVPRGETFRVETHWVGNLRLTSGEGYVRLTVEIAAATVPAYEIEPENSGLRLVIGEAKPDVAARREITLMRGGKRADVRAPEARAAAAEGAAPAPASTETAAEKKYTGQRISLDFKDADIKNVFRLLGEIGGLNIVVTQDVQRRVTLRLVDVPWDQALDLLIETHGLGKEQIGNVVRISTAAQLKAEKDALAEAKKSRENLEELQTIYLSVNYAKVKDLEPKIKPLLTPRGQVVFDERSNTIFVRDIRRAIDDVTTLVSKVDTRTPQVLIESNLVETTPSFARALGIQLQFDLGGSNATFDPVTGAVTGTTRRIIVDQPAGTPFAGDPFFSLLQGKFGPFRNLAAFLSAAESEGNIRIISRPSVMTLNNVASTIQSLRVLRISLPSSTNIASGTGAAAGAAVATEKVPVGIILTVVPQVSADGFILMNISVKSSSIADSPTVSGGGTPVIPFDELSREAIANVLVRDGETIVIGGIMKDTKSTSESGIPYLKDIPILGWLFKNIRWQKDFEELMVFITPRIISAGSENLPSAEQLWREQMRKTEGSQS